MSEQTSPMPGTQPETVDSAGVGALLRASRQRVGEDLRDVSAMLRIRHPYLEAIEEGRYAALPGQTYAVGFVRAYAEHLGLDSEEVVRRYKAEIASSGARHDLHFPTPMAETGIPGGAIVFVGLVVAVVAYGGWYLSTAEDGFLSDLIAPLPERFSALVSGDSAPAKSEMAKPETANPEPAKSEPSETEATQPAPEPATSAPASESDPEPAKPDPATDEVASAQAEPVAVEQVSPGAAETGAPSPTNEALGVSSSAAPSSAAPSPSPQSVPAGSDPTAQAVQPQAAATVSEPPEAPAETAVAPAIQALQPAGQAAPATTLDGGVVAATETPAEARAETTAEIPAETPASEASAAQRPSRISVKAKTNSYIQVRDDFSNTLLVSRVLRAGEVYEVPDKTGLSLLTGNAGALEIIVDGIVVPAIGGDGAVQRGVQLVPELLKAGTAAQ